MHFLVKSKWRQKPFMIQLLKVMKLTTILLFFFLFKASAEGFSQTVTFSGNDVPMQTVFNAIREQTGYTVFCKSDLMEKVGTVSAHLKSASIDKTMKDILKGKSLSYSIIGKTIVIKQKLTITDDFFLDQKEDDNIDVRGRVVNEQGEPVVATVVVKGTKKATSTNENGEFEINDVAEGAILIVSGVNIQTMEIRVSDSGNMQILVRARVVSGEEIVVSTGYQDLKKSQLTGAFSVLNRESYLENVPVNGSILENMEGKIPGLMLNINQSRDKWQDADNTSDFTIRGVSTFDAIKKPLVVLNGYPTEIDIASINPYDIESITVLKDAASAAIYGVRASNGVVVINTVKGRSSRPIVKFTTALTTSPKPDYNKLHLLKGRGFIDFEHDKAINDIENNFESKDYIDFTNGTYTPVFSIADDLYNGLITQAQADKAFDSLAAYDNTDDYKRLFLQNPFIQNYDLNVSGGSDKATYYFGVNYLDRKGSERYSDYNKFSINYRGVFNFTERVSLDVQTMYANANTKSVPIPDYMTLEPYQHFLNKNGDPLPTYFSPMNEDYLGYGGVGGTINAEQNQRNIDMGLYDSYYYPYREMYESSTKNKVNTYRAQANLKAKLIEGMNLEVGGVFEREEGIITNLASEDAFDTRIILNYFAYPDMFTGEPVFGIPQGGIKKTTDNSISSYTLRAQLTYDKLINDKNLISLLAGAEQRSIVNSSSLRTVFGYNDNSLTIKPADLSLLGSQTYFPGYMDDIVPLMGFGVVDQSIGLKNYFDETYSKNHFVSTYANAAYTYDNRYTLTGSLRIDQSNLFGSDPKFRYTPLWSAGASWNISNEDFLAENKSINDLKLRVAAGYNGNIIKGSGPFNILVSNVNTYLPNPLLGYSIQTPRNNELRWEKTFNFNTGIDFGLFSNRLSGSVDYYIKKGLDIFSQVQSDPTFGFSNLYVNDASIENRGLDVMLSTINIAGSNFAWQTQITGSFNNSKVLKVRNKWDGFYMFTRAGGAENIEGHPMNSVLTLLYEGLNENGQPLVRNEDGDLVVVGFDEPDIDFSALHFAGVNDPRYAVGMNHQFTYKNFSLSVLLMYYGGHVGLVTPPQVYDERPTKEMAHFWKEPGDEKVTDIPGFSVFGTPSYFDPEGYINGQKFVRKFDFISVRDITLAYTLPTFFTGRVGLRDTKLKLQVQNAAKYVFSGNDLDPEHFDFVSGRRGLPIVPAFTFSLSTGF